MAMKRNFVVRLNVFEAGVLMGMIHDVAALEEIFKQLLALKEQVDRECGVTKELLPNGLLRLTNEDGQTVTRPPFPWEQQEFER